MQTDSLYSKPVVVNRQTHAAVRLRGATNFAFARQLPAVPLLLSEFGAASGSMPVVFSEDAQGDLCAQAVLGTRQGENVFVGAGGEWRPQAYVPAYWRRSPFTFLETEAEGQEQLVLCMDSAAEHLTFEESADRSEESQVATVGLFDEGVVDHALAFCNAFQRDWQQTQKFIASLKLHDLIVPRRVTVREEGQQRVLEGLWAVDAARLDDLPSKKYLRLRKEGYLPAIYAHLNSWRLFERLVKANVS